ncbi:unnamed protein product [Acanthoscelides obtectus]|uniref:Uncharacterized protein n=1 Tax=Acanthoscelides obtectus TaxID=200917 RepID=A0A9P0P6Q4_ACAOB|nr:unnamed protein product [Acanthoscelides obtectus]CAK1648324.1 hypothetical protein AOBTE_LOCUS15674 [Acanthoscelides obtectus]
MYHASSVEILLATLDLAKHGLSAICVKTGLINYVLITTEFTYDVQVNTKELVTSGSCGGVLVAPMCLRFSRCELHGFESCILTLDVGSTIGGRQSRAVRCGGSIQRISEGASINYAKCSEEKGVELNLTSSCAVDKEASINIPAKAV